MSDFSNSFGRKIEIIQESTNLEIISHLQFYTDIPMVRSWTEVKNISNEVVGLEYVSSFALTGISKEASPDFMDNCYLHIAHNAWKSEFQWRRTPLSDLGLTSVSDCGFSTKRVAVNNTGTWTTKE